MTSKLRKLFAILTVFALLFCQFPGSVTGVSEWAAAEEAGTGESDPVGAPTVLLVGDVVDLQPYVALAPG